ncbi:MAG: LysR family transcriptional regulator [Lachnospiraceae bacterium]|nr:LysR family transcriptional regulator [Lachnospiraceae bacterium]
MNIQKYKALIKTIELESFTKAADALGYSQSGISRMIGDLENEWNVTLLERSKSGLKLTSDGLKILPYAKSVCEAYDKMQMQIDSIHGLETGLIRIGTFSSVATHWLPNIIKAFQKDYPGIEYELLLGDYTEIEEWILEGRVDCGFLRLPASAELDCIFLEKDELKAIIPADHPLAGQAVFPLRELCRKPFMLLEKGARAEISELFERNNLKPDVRFTTWDDYAVMSMVESGLGVSILPELILKRVPYRIVSKSLDVDAYRQIGFVVKDMKTAPIAVTKFVEYLEYRHFRT